MANRMTTIRSRFIAQFHEHGYLRCGLCGFGIASAEEITVDHIVPKSKGGSNFVSNLQPAHRTCNEQKSNTQPETWLDPFSKEKKDEPRQDGTNDSGGIPATRITVTDSSNPSVVIAVRNAATPTARAKGRRRNYDDRKAARDRERRKLAARRGWD